MSSPRKRHRLDYKRAWARAKRAVLAPPTQTNGSESENEVVVTQNEMTRR